MADRQAGAGQAETEPRPAAVTFVTTEHFTLQGARSSTIAEATGRATMFLGAVSGGLVALGLIATAAGVLRGLTPHGLRHSLQTWMDEDGIPQVLKTERMGHEMPGMHGVYGHVSPAMRADLTAALQNRWEISLRERAQLCQRSIVPALDRLLAAQNKPTGKIGSLT
jgi:hypothetical protein